MMKTTHSPLRAGAAIAAALALAPTPLLAQAIDVPHSGAHQPAPPVPATPPPAAVEPTVAPPPAPVEAAPPPATTVTATERTTTTTGTERTTAPAERTSAARTERTAAPRRAAAPAPAAVAEPAAPIAERDIAAPPAAPVAPVDLATPVDDAAPAQSDDSDALAIAPALLAGLAALVLAIWGFIAIGRRKPVARRAVPIVERPVVERPAVAAHATEPVPTAEPAAPVAVAAAAPASSLAHSGAAVPLPRTIPATFEERDALIKRMIAAKPDRANPFTSPIQRRKRAKLILQSIGRDFGDVEPWIDLSQYPQNWPELARNRYAAA